MADLFHPTYTDLPKDIPVFPLGGSLLLPGGHLPLNIFEPRYLEMIQDALGAKRMMAMAQPRPGETSGPAEATPPRLYDIACLGRITSFSEADNGRFLITLVGVCRFRIASELEGRNGYRRVAADYGAFADDLNPPPQVLDMDRERFLGALKKYAEVNNLGLNWGALQDVPLPMLVTSLAMALPFDATEKQALLEADTMQDRAEQLLTLATMGAMAPGTMAGGSIRPQ
ncbi:MAG: LON peptidase substrate-binding domain-containing protein [Rhodospirillaceae bacterium]